jgi:hypothetical protein
MFTDGGPVTAVLALDGLGSTTHVRLKRNLDTAIRSPANEMPEGTSATGFGGATRFAIGSTGGMSVSSLWMKSDASAGAEFGDCLQPSEPAPILPPWGPACGAQNAATNEGDGWLSVAAQAPEAGLFVVTILRPGIAPGNYSYGMWALSHGLVTDSGLHVLSTDTY